MITPRRTRIAILVLAGVVCVAHIAAWRVMLRAQSNVIGRNTAWTVMKREVIYHPSAYEDFLRTPISSQGVNLWLGQGYQGLRWNAPAGAAITRVEAETRLSTPWSYLHLMFRVGGEGAYSILLSRNRDYPSGFYSFAPSWEAVAFEPLRFAASDRPLRVAVAMSGDRFDVSIDGKVVQTFRDARLRDGTVAAKGGFFPTYVRRVEIAYGGKGESRVWADDFARGSTRGWPAVALALLVGFATVAAGALIRVGREGTAVPFREGQGLAFVACAAVSMFLAAMAVRTGTVWLAIAAFAFFAASALAIVASFRIVEEARVGRRAAAAAAAAAAVACGFVLTAAGPAAATSERTAVTLRPDAPLVLSGGALGEQRVDARLRLGKDSIAELRLWSPRFAATPEFRCSSRWHAVVLSTTPSVQSGIYLFDTEPRLLAPLTVRPAIDLRVEARGGWIRVHDGGREIASARANAESGETALMLFSGSGRLERARVEGSPGGGGNTDPGRPWRLPAAVTLGGGALFLLRGRRKTLIELLLLVAATVAALALLVVAREVLLLDAATTRMGIWSVLAMQLIVAAAILRAALRRTLARAAVVAVAALVVAASLVYALIGAFHGPFHVVQLEMQNDVPPTPYAWLWYRHPSFRACNPFVQSQRFADRYVARQKAPGTKRLITIGASQTLGFGASSYDRTYPGAAARELAGDGWEVVNAGVPGSWTVTSRSWFDGVLRHYQPDAVAINFCAADYIYLSLLALEGWDIDAALARIENEGMRAGPVTRALWNVRAWRAFRAFRNGALPDRAKVERAYEASLERLVVAVRKSGAQPLIVLEPKTKEVSVPLLDYPRLYPIAQRVAEKHGALVVDPSHAMELAEQGGIVWWDYAHPTDFGYEVLGREVADALRYGVAQ